jgi:GNAT superfamily N-acetyltransferase
VPPDVSPLPLSKADTVREVVQGPIGLHLVRPDSRLVQRPGWYQILTPSCRHSFLNEVILSDTPEAETDRVIEAVMQEYVALGVPFKWCVGPWTQPPDLGDRLTRLGFRRLDVLGMVLETAAWAAPGPRSEATIETVTEANLDEFVTTYIKGWEFSAADQAATHESVSKALSDPRCARRFYLARSQGLAVATASLFLKESSGYLTGGNVLAGHRHQGIYRQLVAHRLEVLRELAIPLATTHARRVTSAPILERLGFKPVFESRVYFSPELN